jgi:hypothetical protein
MMRSWKLVSNYLYHRESIFDVSHLKVLTSVEKLSSLATAVFSGV